jgi:putative membrane protein
LGGRLVDNVEEVVMRLRNGERGRGRRVSGLVLAAAALTASTFIIAGAFMFAGVLSHAAGLGTLASHMSHHILLMNAAAPLVALMVLHMAQVPYAVRYGIGLLAAATVAQVLLLWGWHAPPVFALAWGDPALMFAMHASLFLAALAFWIAVIGVQGASRWRPILALLITGKLFCLQGALLIFAPRALFTLSHAVHAGHAAGTMGGIADQQLAGLLMIVACPLTYVMAGVVVATRWIFDIERQENAPPAMAGAGA